MHLNQKDKLVTCQNCFYADSICAFYDANRYCVECLCDHACCPECNSGYHAIRIRLNLKPPSPSIFMGIDVKGVDFYI